MEGKSESGNLEDEQTGSNKETKKQKKAQTEVFLLRIKERKNVLRRLKANMSHAKGTYGAE